MRIPLEISPGLNSDDTAFASSPSWADGSCVRFRNGRFQSIGGWESVTLSTLTGVCRTVFSWTDNSNFQHLGFGTHSALQVWKSGGLADITPYGPVAVLGSTPFSVTNASTTVTVTHVGHGLTTGNSVIISGAVDTGGILAANLNGTRSITVTGTDTYTFTAGGSASSTTTGGGTAVRIVPQVALPAGSINGTGSAGWGTGSYGGGTYGTASTDAYYPRTWSLAAWGQKLLGNPRGGSIYEWSNDTSVRAIAVANAPPQVGYMLVTPQFQVMALNCTQENGIYNPKCIRHSSVRDNTVWATDAGSASTAREYPLPGGGYLVAGRVCGKNLLIWSGHELFVGTYVGQLTQVWRFDRVAEKCGLIGPNAAVVVGSTAFWISPDRQFHSYTLGGAVQTIPCTIREDFADNLAASQGDKIVASSISEFDEVRWDYPDGRDGYENSRYIALVVSGPDAGAWSRGEMARTAMVDAGPSTYPCGVTAGGNIYWHEKGASADGGAHAWFIESADIYLNIDRTSLIRGCWPDLAEQLGPVTLTLTTRDRPQGAATVHDGFAISPEDDKVDFKISGRLVRVRFSGDAAPSQARGGSFTFDVKLRGRK